MNQNIVVTSNAFTAEKKIVNITRSLMFPFLTSVGWVGKDFVYGMRYEYYLN